MRVALLELRRKPGRFAIVGLALTLLSLLLLFIGALLDGLFLNSTGAIRAHDADAVVFSDDARESFLRSSVDDETRSAILGVDGVAEVGGLGFSLLGVHVPGEDDIVDGAIAGYELGSSALPDPPPVGEAHADRRIADFGVELGMTVRAGPAEVPIEISGWVDDTNYLLQNALWVAPETWRVVQNANRPDAPVADDAFQVFVVRGGDTVESAALLDGIDAATGTTEALSEADATAAVPGVTEQNRTFTSVIGVTIVVAAVVVALFFALLTIERQGQYAVFKALGAPSRLLVFGVVAQSVVVAVGAFVLGGLLTAGLALVLPPEVPAQFEPGRALFTLVAVVLAAVLGSLVSLRRIINVAPATAISAGT